MLPLVTVTTEEVEEEEEGVAVVEGVTLPEGGL